MVKTHKDKKYIKFQQQIKDLNEKINLLNKKMKKKQKKRLKIHKYNLINSHSIQKSIQENDVTKSIINKDNDSIVYKFLKIANDQIKIWQKFKDQLKQKNKLSNEELE